MIKKNFAFLLIYLFFIAIITTACGGGKSNLSDNSTYYYLLSQQNEPMTPTSTAPQNLMTVPISLYCSYVIGALFSYNCNEIR